ncbi:MAG: tRNA lysidine(34) synthetase TilS [Saprospiraceae bacterium]|nr:tRNA lysidine(34) synthetase TilS [Saprospiraceae bacterium]
MTFITRFWAFILEKNLFSEQDTVLLAVSGGLDSMALLHLMAGRQANTAVAHCNFQLRGAESDADALFVRTEAAKRGLAFYEKSFDTTAFAAEHGLSVQMAARQLRYAWFEELSDAHGFSRIATAHHLDDRVETAWLHFIRGTGLRGLAGMPLMHGRVTRPLLFAARAEIEAFARAEAVSWREDSSNDADYYARNFVRLHLIPGAKKLNPNFLQNNARSLERLRESADNLDFLLAQFLTPRTDVESGVLSWAKAGFEALPGRLQALLSVFKAHGFDEEQMRQLLEGWADTGKHWTSASGARLINNRGWLLLEPAGSRRPFKRIRIDQDDLMVRLPGSKTLFMMAAAQGAPVPGGRDEIVVPAGKLAFPLSVRPWGAGDDFQPFGMSGRHQKLQDFLTNAKLSRLEKEQTLLLENGNGEVIWVIGHRMDERFRVAEGEPAVRFKIV